MRQYKAQIWILVLRCRLCEVYVLTSCHIFYLALSGVCLFNEGTTGAQEMAFHPKYIATCVWMS